MPLQKMNPTSAGRRGMVRVNHPHLYKGDPFAALTEQQTQTGGRNCYGRITTRHRGGGHKHHYRLIDFKRGKEGIAGKVERLEYDPNRSAHIALILFPDGERRYIIAPQGLAVGAEVISARTAPIKPGNCMPLNNIPVGQLVHNVEMKPGKGGQLARSAGASVQLVGRDGMYALVRLRSGELRRVPAECRATIGEVSNAEHNLEKIGKAGAYRWRGIRPTVRGAAMNPVDHPHGGGEGRSGQGNPHPVSPWGTPSKGYKTRNNRRTQAMIIRSRHAKK
jgi:large subunit ribosomal protein L2